MFGFVIENHAYTNEWALGRRLRFPLVEDFVSFLTL